MVVCCSLESGRPEQHRESSLKYQTRCVRAYPDGAGYALSSVEGRIAMEFFAEADQVQERSHPEYTLEPAALSQPAHIGLQLRCTFSHTGTGPVHTSLGACALVI